MLLSCPTVSPLFHIDELEEKNSNESIPRCTLDSVNYSWNFFPGSWLGWLFRVLMYYNVCAIKFDCSVLLLPLHNEMNKTSYFPTTYAQKLFELCNSLLCTKSAHPSFVQCYSLSRRAWLLTLAWTLVIYWQANLPVRRCGTESFA